MRIQFVSRLTGAAAATLRPVAPILVTAGGAIPVGDGRWQHVVSVSEGDQREVVDAGGLRFLTMPFGTNPTERMHDFEWILRELEIARTDMVPVVCVSRGTPGFFLASGTSMEAAVLPHVRALLREPIRAWIAGETPTAKTVFWRGAEGFTTTIRGGSNPFGAAGFCSEIFMDVSTDAVREIPLLRQLTSGQNYGMYRLK